MAAKLKDGAQKPRSNTATNSLITSLLPPFPAGLVVGDAESAQDLEFIVANKVTRIINTSGREVRREAPRVRGDAVDSAARTRRALSLTTRARPHPPSSCPTPGNDLGFAT